MAQLILKRASASRTSGEWSDDDYDVLADGVTVGRIMRCRNYLYELVNQHARLFFLDNSIGGDCSLTNSVRLTSSSAAALSRAPVAERPVALPPVKGSAIMPITPFLDGNASKFDFETKSVMGVAFEMACVRLSGRGDLATDIVSVACRRGD